MHQDAPWSSLSDSFWLLTAGSEIRRSPPQSVRLGAAATALCDLSDVGEVQWNGTGAASSVSVREACRCPDATTRSWHTAMSTYTAGRALAARFSLNPLVRTAWDDVARRLVADGDVVEVRSRFRLSRLTRYRVSDLAAARLHSGRLESAVRDHRLDEDQRALVGAAWASGSFDDLFRIHGISTDGDLNEAARDQLQDDPLTGRLSAALGYSHILPNSGLI